MDRMEPALDLPQKASFNGAEEGHKQNKEVILLLALKYLTTKHSTEGRMLAIFVGSRGVNNIGKQWLRRYTRENCGQAKNWGMEGITLYHRFPKLFSVCALFGYWK